MNKTYAPYHIALAMKEIGFDNVGCFAVYFGDYTEDERNWEFGDVEGFVLNGRDTQYYAQKGFQDGILAPTFQQVFDWFEDEHNIYVQRTVDTSVNEVLDFTYTLKSWRFPPIEIEFENPYDCFDRHKARIACLEKMIEVIKQ